MNRCAGRERRLGFRHQLGASRLDPGAAAHDCQEAKGDPGGPDSSATHGTGDTSPEGRARRNLEGRSSELPQAGVFLALPSGRDLRYPRAPMPKQGWLWELVAERSLTALAAGSLEPVPNQPEQVIEGDFSFLLRTVGNFAKKAELGLVASPSAPNPFLPPDPNLVVTALGQSHIAVLSKYQVIADHLLVVTRAFEPQESLLTREDFQAAWCCLGGKDVLVFFNSGRLAGASQLHKHLQALPLPLGPGPRIPFEPMLDRVVFDGRVSRAVGLPFLHGLARLDPNWSQEEAVRSSYDLYRGFVQALGLLTNADHPSRPAPYNLLMTRQWLLVVPRKQEGIGSLSINALGFCGTLLVKDTNERSSLLAHGLMQALLDVGVPRSG
jgi:sulfate adenylyltransferase (ADP) / ATP adenylyltransferase